MSLYKLTLYVVCLGALLFPVYGHTQNSLSINVVYAGGSSTGFDSAPGVEIDYTTDRYNDWSWSTRLRYTNQKKSAASDGYKYGGFSYLDLNTVNYFFGVGMVASGYKSTFDDGRVWKKRYVVPSFRLGTHGKNYEAFLYITGKERQTENEVRSGGVDIELGENWTFVVSNHIIRYTQHQSRHTGFSAYLGVGYRWGG